MTKHEAIKLLNIGYALFIAGFFAGFLTYENTDMTQFGTGILIAYSFWATYWGVKIVRKPFIQIFYSDHVHVEAKDASDYFYKSFQLKWHTWIVLIIVGFFVGFCGGAILKQIQLSRIAYF